MTIINVIKWCIKWGAVNILALPIWLYAILLFLNGDSMKSILPVYELAFVVTLLFTGIYAKYSMNPHMRNKWDV